MFACCLIVVLLFCLNMSVAAQDIDNETVDRLRQKADSLREATRNYRTETETFNWEEDELMPGLSKEDMEYEYNELGNYIAQKTSYFNASDELVLIVIHEETDLYQESLRIFSERSYFFDKGILFCFRQSVQEDYFAEELQSAWLKEILLLDEEIIYFVRSYEPEEADEMAEEIKRPSELIPDDTKGLYDYDYLGPDW